VIRLAAVGLAVLLPLAVACGGDSSPSGAGDEGSDGHDHEEEAAEFGEEEADARAEVTLKDFEFAGIPATIKGPKAHFTLVNVGAVQHEMLILGGDGKEVAVAPPFPGGNTKTLAAELPAGSYTVECRVREGDKSHADLGMRARLTVT
jgi:hypothetical protein